MVSAEEQFRSFKETFAQWTADIGLSPGLIRAAANLGRSVATQIRAALLEYRGAAAFTKDWKWARLSVPLQIRLLVEQVLWDEGGEWRKLITGFGPIKMPATGKVDKYAEFRARTQLSKSNVIRRKKNDKAWWKSW